MVGKRLIFLAGIIFFCFGTSLGQYTFNWTDSTFRGGIYRRINISFMLHSAQMKDESKMVCDTIVNFMKKNQNIKIAINVFPKRQVNYTLEYISQQYKLSQERANEIARYCIDHGIDSSRIVPKGFSQRHSCFIATTPIKKPVIKQDSTYIKNGKIEIVILKTDYNK